MTETGYLLEVILLLWAAVMAVSLTYHLRLGAIMGYLVAGMAIGPYGFGLIQDLESTRALAEFGVVFLLFTIGLELPLSRIRVTLGPSFLLGLGQVIFATAAGWGVAVLSGLSPSAAFLVGGALAFSSTAMVIRILADQGELTTRFGRAAFAVLIVQDLAVALFLVIVLALGEQGGEGDPLALGRSLALAGLKVVVALVGILGFGRVVLKAILTQVAQVREREVFIALTLLIVLGTGLISHISGLSMAFGAFLAGMLLAETPYRHQVAADIRPFRGLFLGLFFMTVGMTVDLGLAWQKIGLVLLLFGGLLLGKATILAVLARFMRFSAVDSLHLGLLLAQGGEFAFVLIAAGSGNGLLAADDAQLLILVVALTMLVTPLLAVGSRLLTQRLERDEAVPVDAVPSETQIFDRHVVVVGFGRVGRTVAAQLKEAGRDVVAVDLDPHRISQARKAGFAVFYGDATQPDILEALHIERAAAVVVALPNPKASLQVVALIRYVLPELDVFARARNDAHARDLREAGAHLVVPELVQTGVKLAAEVLTATGKS